MCLSEKMDDRSERLGDTNFRFRFVHGWRIKIISITDLDILNGISI